MQLDFSQFHPLDHWPGTQRCRQHFGSWWHHLRLAWACNRRNQVLGWLARWTTCFLGHHAWQVWRIVRGESPRFDVLGAPSDYRGVCRYCHASRTATEDEWW